MIDVSDGLLADLGHVAAASGVTIDLDRSAFEMPEPLQAVAAATGTDPYALVLTGGEDHALAATLRATRPRSRRAGRGRTGRPPPDPDRACSSTERRGRPRPGSTTSAPGPDRRVTHRFGRLFA